VMAFGALPLQRTEVRRGETHKELRLRLTWDAHFLERTEAGLFVGAYRRNVVDRWADHAHADTVEWKRDVAHELTEHRRSVTPPDEVGLTDEEIDPDGILTEGRERVGAARISSGDAEARRHRLCDRAST